MLFYLSKLNLCFCAIRCACGLQPGCGAHVNASNHASCRGPRASMQRGRPESSAGHVPQPGQGGGSHGAGSTAGKQGCCHQLAAADGWGALTVQKKGSQRTCRHTYHTYTQKYRQLVFTYRKTALHTHTHTSSKHIYLAPWEPHSCFHFL